MPKQKIEVGDIRPIYNVTGFQVCKVSADDSEEAEWVPVEKISEAETLSFIYKQQKEVKGQQKNTASKKITKLREKMKQLEEEPDEEEIDDEEL